MNHKVLSSSERESWSVLQLRQQMFLNFLPNVWYGDDAGGAADGEADICNTGSRGLAMLRTHH